MKPSESLHAFLKEKFDSEITKHTPVGGGCINDAARVSLANGTTLFVKQNRRSLLDMFEKEARGLELLNNAVSEIRIPEIVGVLDDESTDTSWLILSFVEEGRSTGDFDLRFGRALAEMHQHRESRYGLDHHNYIGRLPQNNDWRDDWISFFRECRIEPQFKMAQQSGYFSNSTRQSLDHLFEALPDIFPDEPASLLHGDLWGGN